MVACIVTSKYLFICDTAQLALQACCVLLGRQAVCLNKNLLNEEEEERKKKKKE